MEINKTVIKKNRKNKIVKVFRRKFLNTILTYSYSPQKNLTQKNFKNKIDWLIKIIK